MRFKKIYLEITTNCNKNCEFCKGTKRKSESLTVQDFENRIKQVANLGERIYLYVAGEPLLHPELNKFLLIAKTYGVSIGITTNASLIEKQFSALLLPALNELNISLHSVAINNNELEQTVKSVLKLRNRRNDLQISFRLWNGINSLNHATKLYELLQVALNEGIRFSHDFKSAGKQRIAENLFLHFDSEFSWNKNATPQKNGFCYGLQNHFAILCDGSVLPCCICKDGEIILGNINEKSISQILSSPRAKAIVGGFGKKVMVEEVCQRCEFAQKKFSHKINKR
jgi:radical SAM protein with 4Fe4S-binding SPASM domain